MKNSSATPLEGLRVIDLTRLLPGPLCAMLLGDYGAEVIKIEDTDAGDPTRFVGITVNGCGSFFRQLNRNKRSLAVNLKTDEGREILKKLSAGADILIEGFRPGVMAKLGLDYAALKKINPGLVYASISGYGQKGSYALRAGHDLNYTALTGLLDLSAAEGKPPAMPAVQIADIAAGSLVAVNGIMFALYQKAKSGEGSHVDIAMTRGQLPFMAFAASAPAVNSNLPRSGSGHITGAFACYQIYRTADDRYMSLGALEPVFWKNFCQTVDRPQWIDQQFDTTIRLELIEQVNALFRTKTRSEWCSVFAEADACCEPVLNMEEAVCHPLNIENRYWLENRLDDGTAEILIGFPLLFSDQPGSLRLQAPQHGEHNETILKEVGYSEDQIDELKKIGVIN
jgi:crotonobetainyl-CoA:carnitine CoA-transferase CaiB-like acyl-CoA transferase